MNKEIKKLSNLYAAQIYGKKDVVLSHGIGSMVWDFDGKKYIDFTSGIGVNSLGHANEGIVNAVTKQLQKLSHTSNLYYNEPSVTLSEKLCKKSGMDKVFICNSGAEANEGAIKWARAYGEKVRGKNCFNIVTLTNSFHGRTLTTLAATGQDSFHVKFQPLTQGFKYAESGNLQDTLSKLTPDVCAVMFELVQGEGGVNVLDKQYVQEIVKQANSKDILVILDEIQTGLGRTGTLFASEQYDIKPDITTLAKGLGGGLPIGAVLLGNKVSNVLEVGDHGTTFGGNLLSCASANYVLDTIDDQNFLNAVNSKSQLIKNRLNQIDGVVCNGLGLMMGVEKQDVDSAQVINDCAENGLLVLSAKKKIRLLPSLNITENEICKGLRIMENCL